MDRKMQLCNIVYINGAHFINLIFFQQVERQSKANRRKNQSISRYIKHKYYIILSTLCNVYT